MSNVMPPAPNQDPLRPGTTTNSKIVMPRVIRRAAMALAVVGLFAFGAIVVSAYKGKPTDPSQVPLITADNAPLRERPAEEGGMQVANRDSTVYDQLDNHGTRPGLERLMPAAETPIDGPAMPDNLPEPRRPDGTPALTADEIRMLHEQRRATMQRGDAGEQAMQQLEMAANSVPQGVAQGQTSTVASAERIELPVAAEQTAAAPQIDHEEPSVQETAAASATAAAASPAPQATAPAAQPAAPVQLTQNNKPASPSPAEARAAASVKPAAGVSARVVQLGAVRTEAAAKAEWSRLQKKYPSQLGSLDVSVQQVNLGARGIYWRIQGGPVSADQGKKICDALKASAQSCMVVGR